MRKRTLAAVGAIVATVGAVAMVTLPAQAGTSRPSPKARELARQVLPAGDGWAATGTGTTGGSAAGDASISVARNRTDLVAALGGDNTTNATNDTPKIIFVSGRIDANVDADNEPLTCADYADPGYSLDAFLAAYDPEVWGWDSKPSGELEDARVRSTKNQAAQVNISVGSNTTIIGLPGSQIRGMNLLVKGVDNVVLRNLTFEDAYDCFPAWNPTDGSAGNWNSKYDTVTVHGSTHVWVDHNDFSDGNNTDDTQPLYFGRPYQVHDGLLDIIKGADLVTVSYNRFFDHDKTMLIGSTNTVGVDVDKLRVTVHHNMFANIGQRTPRVRFGQVDVYNNYYRITDADTYEYSWGVGVYSAIYAENNVVVRSAEVAVEDIVYNWGGTVMTEIGTLVRVGAQPPQTVSLLDAFNTANDPDIGTDAGWTPTLRPGPITPTAQVQRLVSKQAGAGRIRV
ncbi:MAG: polysaccharide lyase family 1 protein [Dactylosporangium sp.]|nr:polysaccharide lyase family 1 protein [Dactylosporangium sp.]NNJ61633.1 polysaccharide lyase family 1 protein [Dactylosporangium sp.]